MYNCICIMQYSCVCVSWDNAVSLSEYFTHSNPAEPHLFFIIYSQACVWLLRDFRLVSFYGKMPRPCGRNVEESPTLFLGAGFTRRLKRGNFGETRKFRKKWEQN
jgi:hypothetical protein